MGSRINSRDVAAAARVSQSTVSRVINGSANVRPETRMRVEREMAALGCIPNAAALSLMTRRTQMLGLVVSNITYGFYPEKSERPRREVLPAEIVVRGTCGPHEAPHPSPRLTSLSSRRPARQHARVPALIGGPS